MRGLTQDVRYALRAARRAPVFSAVAIACLAVGIGVNAAAFSVVDTLLVRDLPGVVRQKEINAILLSYEYETGGRASPAPISTLDWEAFRGGMSTFASSGVMGPETVALRLAGGALAARGDFVSGDYFALLGAQPIAGRALTRDDDRAGAPPAVVISYDLWQREFSGRTDAIGTPLYIAGVPFTIVGVAPRGFVGLYPGELVADPEHGAPYVILPLAAAPLVRAESRHTSIETALDDNWLLLIGRRRPGVTEAQVEAQAGVVATALAAQYPRNRNNASAFVRAPSTATKAETIAGFAFVMAMPLLILLVACANLANQLLARAAHRGREIAVRLSLGATRARVVRLLLVESTLLAVAASVVGVVLARLMTDALQAFALVNPFRIPMDVRVVLFTTALALITPLAFGLVPSLRATRLDLAQSIKEGGAMGGYQRSRLRNTLVVTQVAASVALLAAAGVFMRGAQRSRISDTEGNANRVLTVGVDLDLLGYTEPAGHAFQSLALERLGALPGVEAVAQAPFGAAGSIPPERVSLPGDAPDRLRYYETIAVRGDWFGMRNTRPLAGRLFTATEAHAGAPVAVVDAVVARKLWPDQSAIGQVLRIGEGESAIATTVIGVMPTVRDRNFHNDDGVITIPARAGYDPHAYFYLRARDNAADLRAAARDVIRQLDARLPPAEAVTLGEALDEIGRPASQMASGAGVMGIISLLLATLGLSAVLSFIVEQRRYEIGVRVALGAQSSALTWLVVRQSLVLAALGIVIGALVAAAAATMMRGILFGLPPIDPIAFAGSTTVLFVVALLASAGPARKAARVDPLMALRAE